MPTAYWRITQGNRDYSAPPAGGGSDSATFGHAKGWNGADVRDIWARLDHDATSDSLEAGDSITSATLYVCSTGDDNTNDLDLDLHWFTTNLPGGFTMVWDRSSTTLSSYSLLVQASNVPGDALTPVDVTPWLLDLLANAGYTPDMPIGLALLGSAERAVDFNLRTYDNNPALSMYLEVKFSKPSGATDSTPIGYVDQDGTIHWTIIRYVTEAGTLA